MTDPIVAATGAWLARLPAAERAAAQAATDWRLGAWAAGFAALIGAAWLLARVDLAGRVARRTERAFGRVWLGDAAAAATLALALGAVSAALSAFADWRADAILTGSSGTVGSLIWRLRGAAAGLPPLVLVAALAAPPLFWLIRRRPRSWPLAAAPLLSALLIAGLWLPYALAAGPALALAPPSPTQAGIARLLADTGLATRGIYVAPTLGFDADVTGGLAPPKVVVGPDLLAAPAAQARASVGHLIGHFAHHDILIVTLVLCATLSAGLFVAAAGAAPLARLMGESEARGAADAASLPAAAAILIVALYGGGLAGSAYLRWANVRADAYSLDHAREPDGLAAALEHGWDHDAVDPSPLEEAVFYTHPPLKERIGHAMTWKSRQATRAAFSNS